MFYVERQVTEEAQRRVREEDEYDEKRVTDWLISLQLERELACKNARNSKMNENERHDKLNGVVLERHEGAAQ